MALDKGKFNNFSSLSFKQYGKKKIVRKKLHFLSFNPDKLSDVDKQWMLNIIPKYRGIELSKYYSNKCSGYNPSSSWINTQVNNTCRWIRKTLTNKKSML